MQNDAAAIPTSSPLTTDKPEGFGAQVAMFGPIVLVVFLIVVFRVSDKNATVAPDVSVTSSPAVSAPAVSDSPEASAVSKEAEAALLDKLIEDSQSGANPNAAVTAPAPMPGVPGMARAPAMHGAPGMPAQGWAPPPPPGGAYWGAPNQGQAPAAGGYPQPYPYGYPPYPYPPYGADPYWWSQQPQGGIPQQR